MNDLKKNISNLYGEEGKRWLANLPLLTAQMEIAYGLSNLEPFNNLSYNYVLFGFKALQPIVLKLGLDSDALKREAHALKAFKGCGVVKILIEKEGTLLLERAAPGVALKSYFPESDNDAIHITCECLKRLHQAAIPARHRFPHIQDWLMALDKECNIPTPYLNKARTLRSELIATSDASVLLHGDLHHDNILQYGNDWVVIDPKGVIGEPAYEVAAFIRNPIPQLLKHSDASNIIRHRIKYFAKLLELSEQRIVDWCYVQAVLAWVWALEDGCDTVYFKKLTELFNSNGIL